MKPQLSILAGVAAAGFIAAASAAGQPPPPQASAPPATEDSLGAGWRQQQDEARQLRRQQRIRPLAGVIEEIRRRTPGHQLDAGLEYQGDRAVYRVRWMTADGRRIDYMIDAATGQVLSGQ